MNADQKVASADAGRWTVPIYDEVSEEVIQQRNWTEKELRARGYAYYMRRKEVTMARELPITDAPLKIRTHSGQELIANAGYIICYKPGNKVRPRLTDYEHWPVEPTIFFKTYKPWDEDGWKPSPSERHLMRFGCQPFYKAVGVWAKLLDVDAMLQSKEHIHPVEVKTGEYIAVGADGEPYSMGAHTFHSRYEISQRLTLAQRFRKLLGLK
jgi:hypothetical protein